MHIIPEDLIKLGVAFLVGAIIGAEREHFKKPAGLRTLTLISLGSALFTILSLRVGASSCSDAGRIAAGIVSGIGFLGAGVILQERGKVVGLTTAATIWLVSALGMAAGIGEYALACVSAVVTVLVLIPLAKIEERLDIGVERRIYEITTEISRDKFKEIKSIFKTNKMVIEHYKQEKRDKDLMCTFEVSGSIKQHDKVVQKFLADKDIREISF